MVVDAEVTVRGSKAATWTAMTDIENAATMIRGVEKIEIVEKPANGLVGLRWRETRMLFGKPATAEKWITEAVHEESYKTRAESDGFAFLSTTRISACGDGIVLQTSHASVPQTFVTRLQALVMGLLFRGVIRKALLQDLNDIKARVERG